MDRHQLSSPNDYVVVYDGTDANAPLLTVWSPDGFAVSPVVTKSGVAFITFTSDNTLSVLSGFLIVWHSHAQCPNQCSSNGYCLQQGCTCFQGWSGIDCSQPITSYEALTPTVRKTAVIGEFELKTYVITVPNPVDTLTINFSRVALETPPKGRWGGGEILFAINYNAPASVYQRVWIYWLEANAFIIENPSVGQHYLSVYGQESSGYTLLVQPFALTVPALPSSTGLPNGAIAGIVIAVVAVALVVLGVGAFIAFRRRRASRFNEMQDEAPRTEKQ